MIYPGRYRNRSPGEGDDYEVLRVDLEIEQLRVRFLGRGDGYFGIDHIENYSYLSSLFHDFGWHQVDADGNDIPPR